MLLRLWEFDDGGGGGRGGAVRPSPRWLATIWWGRFLVIHIMMAHQFRRVMKQTMVWKSVMGARLLLAYCRRFFLRVSVWLYVWVSLSQRKTHTPKDERERERERETETVCFIVWHKGGWVQQVDLLYPEWLWWPLGSNTDQTI